MEQLLTDWGFPDYVAKFIGRQYYCVCDVCIHMHRSTVFLWFK